MNNDILLSKIDILIRQKKFDDAHKYLGELLSQEPNNIQYLALLAEVCLQKEDIHQAESVINNAIGLAPNEAYLYYVKSRIKLQQYNYSDGEKHIREAIQFEPYDADYFALLSNILLARKQFDEALDAANSGLEIDAENVPCLNARSAALIKLNRKDESYQTIEGALNEDPNNYYTHTNYGWGLLEKGEHKKALEHFKEALSINPNFAYAQAGMLEAIKASNTIYRLFLKYAFWMGKLSAKYQWGVIIGFYLVVRFLRAMANSNPNLEPYLTPIVLLLTVVAFSTWIIEPISNLFLRFNKYGKMLLGKHEKTSANFVAISFLVFFIGLILYFISGNELFMPVAVYGLAMMMPLGSMFIDINKSKTMLYYTLALSAVGLAAVVQTYRTEELINSFSGIFLLGIFGFQWLANYTSIQEGNR